jgi:predicted permease
VVAEIALSVVLVAGAGLMLRSLWGLQHVDPGFNTEGLVTMRLNPPDVRYADDESLQAYYAQVKERLLAVPGVSHVGMTNSLPMGGGGMSMRISAPESTLPEEDHPPYTTVQSVSVDYFEAMDIPLLAGRDFTPADRVEPPRAIINRSAAEGFWPGEDPIGKKMDVPVGIDEPFTVIGVVDDINRYSLTYPPLPEAYFSHMWWTESRMYLAVRVAGDPVAQIPALQAVIWSVDRDVPIAALRTMDEVVGRTLAYSRLLATLLVTFGILALSLGAIGVYGVVSYTVSQSTYEIGLRMALGAAKTSILTRILRHSLALAGLGIVLGVVGSWAATRVLSRFLYDVEATDPLTFGAVALVLTVVALVASYLPAHRASRVDPLVAIKID